MTHPRRGRTGPGTRVHGLGLAAEPEGPVFDSPPATLRPHGPGEDKLKSQTNANNTALSITYNEARGWPTQLDYTRAGVSFARYDLTYDLGLNTVGNLTGVTELDGSTASFG